MKKHPLPEEDLSEEEMTGDSKISQSDAPQNSPLRGQCAPDVEMAEDSDKTSKSDALEELRSFEHLGNFDFTKGVDGVDELVALVRDAFKIDTIDDDTAMIVQKLKAHPHWIEFLARLKGKIWLGDQCLNTFENFGEVVEQAYVTAMCQ